MYTRVVNLESISEMKKFLISHKRTEINWNGATSYSQEINGIDEALFHDKDQTIDFLLDDFGRKFEWRFQARLNSSSLVLYRGEKQESKYKSYCTVCYCRSIIPAKEHGTKCTECGGNTMVDFENPLVNISFFSGEGIDKNEDFFGWAKEELQERTKVVMEFDKLAENIKYVVISIGA